MTQGSRIELGLNHAVKPRQKVLLYFMDLLHGLCRQSGWKISAQSPGRVNLPLNYLPDLRVGSGRLMMGWFT